MGWPGGSSASRGARWSHGSLVQLISAGSSAGSESYGRLPSIVWGPHFFCTLFLLKISHQSALQPEPPGSWLLNELQQELRPRTIIGQKKWPILGEGRAICMYRARKDLGGFTVHLCSPRPWLGSSSGYIHLYSFRMGTSKKGSTYCVLG